jgi:hypothetical protein
MLPLELADRADGNAAAVSFAPPFATVFRGRCSSNTYSPSSHRSLQSNKSNRSNDGYSNSAGWIKFGTACEEDEDEGEEETAEEADAVDFAV